MRPQLPFVFSRLAMMSGLVAVASCAADGSRATLPASNPPALTFAVSSSNRVQDSKPAMAKESSAAFAKIRDRALDAIFDLEPSTARDLGLHEYDGKIADYSAAGIKAKNDRYRKLGEELATVDTTALSEDDALDHALLKRQVEYGLFVGEDLERWHHFPQYYEELFSVNAYLDREYAPLEQRAKALVTHEKAALAQVSNLRANLKSPMSKPVVETAAKNYKGFAEYLRGDVVKLVKGVKDPALLDEFRKTNEALAAEAASFSNYLKTVELPKADGSHVLGADKYKKLLRIQEGFTGSLDEFKAMGEENLSQNRKAFEAIRSQTTIARPAASTLLADATSLVQKSRQFLIDKKIVTIPSDDPATVKETPPYMRWNAASLNPPGPFETAKGVDALYYITLPDKSWSKKEQEEYVMPRGNLVATTVHEVFPGHFLQSLWIRKAPSKVQKAFGSYSFVEGWAHYTEQMMVEEGFLADDPQIKQGQLVDALLRNCRYVVSYGMHVEGLSLDQGEKRFVEECHQDKATAREQTVRGTFDPGYFAYTLGKLQILKLREEAKQKLGPEFSLLKFHDALLAHGSPPVQLIGERVLHEINAK